MKIRIKHGDIKMIEFRAVKISLVLLVIIFSFFAAVLPSSVSAAGLFLLPVWSACVFDA